LSSIEGIDHLAFKNGACEEVKNLTQEAMGKTGLNPTLYRKRLDLVKPTQQQVISLGMEYFTHRVPDAENIIALLKRLNKAVYIISAGLTSPVTIFGNMLQIPVSNIFAVNIEFDDQGHFLDFNHHSPLVTVDGKRQVINEIKTRHEKLAFIGDGLNDLAAADLVTRFVGYGGVFFRENIAAQCQFYIKTLSLAPLLPLVLTEAEQQSLLPAEKKLYTKGLQAIQDQQVIVPG
jgi:phosphoserine phosphatase